MRQQLTLQIALLSCLAAIVLGGFLITHTNTPTIQTASTHLPAATVATIPIVNRGLPMQLNIPRLDIAATIDYMGLTPSGNMDTPASLSKVGWYKYGPLPGNKGSAVISGHITGPRGVPAIFSDLNKMQVGDVFSITDSTAQSTNFVVRDIQLYDQDAQISQVFESKDGSHLNLISCSGEWNTVQRHFLKRLVVFSDKVM